MLVLSRKPDQRIVFPTLGVTIHVVRVQGNVVRVGIEAPPNIPIFREELCDGHQGVQTAQESSRHRLANRLNKLGLALHLTQKQLDACQYEEAESTLMQALPLLEALDKELEVPKPKRPVAYRALIVDDDDNERELLAGLLRMNGCDCRTAANGQEALADLGTHELPDVVLLDLMMPQYDGRQTIQAIRANPKLRGLKVFAVTGMSPQQPSIAQTADGFDAWFSKPLNPLRLWDAIQQSANSAHAAN